MKGSNALVSLLIRFIAFLLLPRALRPARRGIHDSLLGARTSRSPLFRGILVQKRVALSLPPQANANHRIVFPLSTAIYPLSPDARGLGLVDGVGRVLLPHGEDPLLSFCVLCCMDIHI